MAGQILHIFERHVLIEQPVTTVTRNECGEKQFRQLGGHAGRDLAQFNVMGLASGQQLPDDPRVSPPLVFVADRRLEKFFIGEGPVAPAAR